jgi:hypothetical protein
LQGFAVKKADVRELLRRHGEEESATIGLETFQRVMTDKLSERTPQDDMRRAFQVGRERERSSTRLSLQLRWSAGVLGLG